MEVDEVEKFFYRNPDEQIHFRELCREVGKSPSYVSARLERLVEEDAIEEKHRGNMKIYKANTSEKRYRKNKKLFNLWQLTESGLAEKLDQKLYPDAIVLFGSYLEGRDHQDSDIDIAVINGRERELDLTEFEDFLGREVQLITLNDLEGAEKEFKATLSNGYVLKGYLDLF